MWSVLTSLAVTCTMNTLPSKVILVMFALLTSIHTAVVEASVIVFICTGLCITDQKNRIMLPYPDTNHTTGSTTTDFSKHQLMQKWITLWTLRRWNFINQSTSSNVRKSCPNFVPRKTLRYADKNPWQNHDTKVCGHTTLRRPFLWEDGINIGSHQTWRLQFENSKVTRPIHKPI